MNTHPIPDVVAHLDVVALETLDQQTPAVQSDQSIMKYGLFKTSIGYSLVAASTFAIGANVRHHPIHNGAITALTGGAIVGAIAGIIGSSLGIKKEGNSFKLQLCSLLLEYACFSAIPLGAQITPFKQNLPISTLVEDQLIGNAVILSSLLALTILLISYMSCKLSREQRHLMSQTLFNQLRSSFATTDLIMSLNEAPAVLVNHVPVATMQVTDTPEDYVTPTANIV